MLEHEKHDINTSIRDYNCDHCEKDDFDIYNEGDKPFNPISLAILLILFCALYLGYEYGLDGKDLIDEIIYNLHEVVIFKSENASDGQDSDRVLYVNPSLDIDEELINELQEIENNKVIPFIEVDDDLLNRLKEIEGE